MHLRCDVVHPAKSPVGRVLPTNQQLVGGRGGRGRVDDWRAQADVHVWAALLLEDDVRPPDQAEPGVYVGERC